MTSQPRNNRQLSSDAELQLQRYKRGLVLDLFLRCGSFWNAVLGVRSRWNITAVRRLPPPLPEDGHLAPGIGPNPPPPKMKPKEAQEWTECFNRWIADLQRFIYRPLVPDRYHGLEWWSSWSNFLSACVLYDPPETDLLAFAAYDDPKPQTPHGHRWLQGTVDEQFPRMVAPPIKFIWHDDPFALQRAEKWYWAWIIAKVGEQYLEPLGLDTQTVIDEILANHPWIREGYEEMTKVEPHRYITVEEHTTEEDIRRAFRMLAATHESRPPANRPPRDELLAVQCAILYDRHNHTDSSDRRRRKWTHERLSKQFGLKSSRAAKEYVAAGREMLRNI